MSPSIYLKKTKDAQYIRYEVDELDVFVNVEKQEVAIHTAMRFGKAKEIHTAIEKED